MEKGRKGDHLRRKEIIYGEREERRYGDIYGEMVEWIENRREAERGGR